MGALRPSTVWALLSAFVALLGAFVALVLTGHDPQALAGFAATVLGFIGLGAHQAAQGKTIAKIDKQTNGVLTGRIKAAVADALNEVTNVIPTTPVDNSQDPSLSVADPAPETPNEVVPPVTVLDPSQAPVAVTPVTVPDPSQPVAPVVPASLPAPEAPAQFSAEAIAAAVVAALQATQATAAPAPQA